MAMTLPRVPMTVHPRPVDQTRRRRGPLGAAAALLATLLAPMAATAQMYGPRQFLPAPTGTSVLTISSFYTQSNTIVDTNIVFPQLNVDTVVVAPSLSHFFPIGGQLAQATVAVPYVWANVALSESTTGLAVSPARDGFADSYAHLTVGMINAPALDPKSFAGFMASHNPRVVGFGLLGTYLPTGAYDTQRAVNIGTNRWTLRAGVPLTVRLSDTWAPGRTSTLEVLPTIDVFTPNNDPANPSFDFQIRGRNVGRALSRRLPDLYQTTQDPLAALELHLTHDLNRQLWVSLDSYSKLGGETYADGEANSNQQLWTALGGTLGGSPWSGARLAATGGGVIGRNDNSPNGWLVRLQFQQAW